MSVPRVDLTDPSVEPTDDELEALMQSVCDEVVKRHAPAQNIPDVAWMEASREAATGTVTVMENPKLTPEVAVAAQRGIEVQGGIGIVLSPPSGLSVLSESADRHKGVRQMREMSGSGNDS